jgi:hypothetical protein
MFRFPARRRGISFANWLATRQRSEWNDHDQRCIGRRAGPARMCVKLGLDGPCCVRACGADVCSYFVRSPGAAAARAFLVDVGLLGDAI